MKEIKKFGIRSFFLVLVLIVLIGFTNLLYNENIQKNKEIIRQEASWQEYKAFLDNNTLEYGVFGDSHAMNGLNPKYINDTFNFATNGEGYVETYYKLRKIFEKDNVRVNTLILQLDTQSFSSRLRDKNLMFNELPYYSEFVPLKDISELKGEKRISLVLENNIRILGKGNEIVKYAINPPTLTQLYQGWSNNTKNKTYEGKVKELPDAYETHFGKGSDLLDETGVEYFIKVLNYAKENNVNIVFVKYPVTKSYADYIDERGVPREEYYEELFEIIDVNLEDYEVLDYYDLFFDDYGLFADSNHVNWKGSELLSIKVQKDLSELEPSDDKRNFFYEYLNRLDTFI